MLQEIWLRSSYLLHLVLARVAGTLSPIDFYPVIGPQFLKLEELTYLTHGTAPLAGHANLKLRNQNLVSPLYMSLLTS